MTNHPAYQREYQAEFEHLIAHPEAVIEGAYQPDSYWYTDPDSGERTWIDLRGMIALTFETHLLDETEPVVVTMTITVDREAWESEGMKRPIRETSIRQLAVRVVDERERRARYRAIAERGRIESGGTFHPPGDNDSRGLFQRQESKWDR